MTPARVAAVKKAKAARSKGQGRRLRELKQVMAEFEQVDVAEPAVKPDRETAKAIRKGVRAFYEKRDALEPA